MNGFWWMDKWMLLSGWVDSDERTNGFWKRDEGIVVVGSRDLGGWTIQYWWMHDWILLGWQMSFDRLTNGVCWLEDEVLMSGLINFKTFVPFGNVFKFLKVQNRVRCIVWSERYGQKILHVWPAVTSQEKPSVLSILTACHKTTGMTRCANFNWFKQHFFPMHQ